MPSSRNRTRTPQSALMHFRHRMKMSNFPGRAFIAFLGLFGAAAAVFCWGMVWCNLNLDNSVDSQNTWLIAGACGWVASQVGAFISPGDPYHQQGSVIFFSGAAGALLLGPIWSLWLFPAAIAALVVGGAVLVWKGFYTQHAHL